MSREWPDLLLALGRCRCRSGVFCTIVTTPQSFESDPIEPGRVAPVGSGSLLIYVDATDKDHFTANGPCNLFSAICSYVLTMDLQSP
jgi:hypothetical protein